MLLTSSITKPTYPAAIVDRPRLYRQLDRWRDVRGIAVHAPAGYGKSSLISRWIDVSELEEQAAWFTLDESVGNPRDFVHGFAAALEKVQPGLLSAACPILEDAEGSAERVLARLLTILEEGLAAPDAGSQHLLLVLDDLHRIHSAEIDTLLLTILQHGPSRFHLVLLARQRTDLPLARLIAHEQVVLLTKEDLRFTEAEVRELLEQQGFAPPSDSTVAQLAQRSEGWVTALKLAMLSTLNRGAPESLVAALQSERSWLTEYLIEEVLRQQTPDVRTFLLHTSILDEFNAELSAAVTRIDNAYSVLSEIVHNDLFVVTSNSSGGWYRYHHLFQDLLKRRLAAREAASPIVELHVRAADWLLENDRSESALHHLLAAGLLDDAAEVVERLLSDMMLRDPHRAKRVLEELPAGTVQQRPRLLLDRIRLALLVSAPDIRQVRHEIEVAFNPLRESGSVTDALVAEFAVLQAGADYLQHDQTAATKHLEKARRCLDQLDDFGRGTYYFIRLNLLAADGTIEEVTRYANEAITAYGRAGFSAGVISLRREVARKAMHRGSAGEANELFRNLLDRPVVEGPMVVRELITAYLCAAENSYWQNDLGEAKPYLWSLKQLAEKLQDKALIYFAASLEQAYAVEGEAECLKPGVVAARMEEISDDSLRSYLLDLGIRRALATQSYDDIREMASFIDLSISDLTPEASDRHLVPRLFAQAVCDASAPNTDQILAAALAHATSRGDRFRELRLLAFSSWLRLQQAKTEQAIAIARRAAELAGETGYVRVLSDIPKLAQLLPHWEESIKSRQKPGKSRAQASPDEIGLTRQEARVLALLAQDRTYQQIAEELVISINTVRTHVRHLYRKLSARRRDQAIEAAYRFGVLHADF